MMWEQAESQVSEKTCTIIANCYKRYEGITWVRKCPPRDIQGRCFQTSGISASPEDGKNESCGEGGRVFLREGAACEKAQEQEGVRVPEEQSKGRDKTAHTLMS